METQNQVAASDDALVDLETRIARRADELAHLHGTDPRLPLSHWRQAEREVWHDQAPRVSRPSL